MKGGYCINWSAWRVWLHPQVAFRALHKSEKMETDSAKRLEEALKLIEEQKFECARLTNEVSELRRRYMEKDALFVETKRALDNALEELNDHESVEKKLAEFEKILSAAEKMKYDYEKRIRTLESRLRDAKIKSKREDDDELIGAIDMTARDIPQKDFGPPPSMGKKSSTPDSLLEDTDKAFRDFYNTNDNNDWLIPLPDNL
ncbi:MAG: hypothetical protein HDR88_13715 [Bacteroides sp.]|nr:hypothetical protein [Bacteroides sp.]